MILRNKVIRSAALLAAIVGFSGIVEARPIVPRSILKSYFQSGDRPTQQQFSTLIDSELNTLYNDRYLLGLRIYGQEGYRVQRLRVGEITPPQNGGSTPDYGLPTPSSLLQMEPDFAGQFGYAALLFSDSHGEKYYGFLQVAMDSPPDADGSPVPLEIHVQYVAIESTPNTLVTTFVVPEPTSIGAIALAGWITRRRR